MSGHGRAVPDFLHGTLESMAFGQRAGEWELDVGSPDAPLSELVATFAGAFGWGEQQCRLEAWLKAAADDGAGFHATLDLALFWEDDEIREAVVPDSGKLWFERDTDGLTLTIWPNLFTDLRPALRTERHAQRPLPWPSYVGARGRRHRRGHGPAP